MFQQYVQQQRKIYEQYQQFNSEFLRKMQSERDQPLRFSLNDRVVCNLGPRWVGGKVVGADVDNEEDWAYLVKTDPHPGMKSDTISVPEDSEEICVQEVCFSAASMMQIKGAAPEVASKQRL